jgi:hypothetical protein
MTYLHSPGQGALNVPLIHNNYFERCTYLFVALVEPLSDAVQRPLTTPPNGRTSYGEPVTDGRRLVHTTATNRWLPGPNMFGGASPSKGNSIDEKAPT